MANRHYEIERTMTKPSAGGTVTPTTTGDSPCRNSNENDETDGVRRVALSRAESKPALRKRRRTEPTLSRTGIPRKTPRRTGEKEPGHAPDERAPEDVFTDGCPENVRNENEPANFPINLADPSCSEADSTSDANKTCKTMQNSGNRKVIKSEDISEKLNEDFEAKNSSIDKCNDAKANEKEFANLNCDEKESKENVAEEETEMEQPLSTKPPMHPDAAHRRSMTLAGINRRDDSARLRKTIQWLEEGARKLREDLAETRAELYEERRAARLARREIEVAVREARAAENAKHSRVIAELKTRLSQSPSRSTTEPNPASAKAELLKDENHRREISAAKKRLAEADATIRKLRSSSLDPPPAGGSFNGKRRKIESPAASELRKLDAEVKALRAANKKMEEKLNIVCAEADKVRIMELRIQHENHETEINALKKSLRSDAIRMMDEIRNKDREIERLRRLARENRKSCAGKEDDAMRKLRENENGHQIRLTARIEDKVPQVDNSIDLCKGECEAVAEVERLRDLAIEQQEVIELLRQAVKEKERKLDQLSNKRRKEEFYKQWLELEPVAEVDDEEEHEEEDSALSSAPSSLSPQPGGCGHWQSNGVTREAYEAVLLEIDQLQTKFLDEQQELVHAKSQVRDLEKALLQETRGSQNSRRALSEKLRKLEDREASLLAEIAELGEQNELLEFRVLELEESPGLRETPDTADSGIVSPEPIHIFKEQNNKQRDRAVATVLPFSAYTHPTSPVPVKKPSLSLQESGIFEDDDDDEEEEEDTEEDVEVEANNREIEFTSCGTQTEAPVGELLQEVQRLQELRERFQERAVKVPSGSSLDVKSAPSAVEFNDAKALQDDKSSSYREKIRALEVRLSSLEEEQECRVKNDLVAKQREEDLLDENYRLTERVYWLENELRDFEGANKSFVDVETMTETEMKNSLIHAETMTFHDFSDAETMTEASKTFVSRVVEATPEMREEFREKSCEAAASDSSISRCENLFRSALRENMNGATEAAAKQSPAIRVDQKLRAIDSNEKKTGDECRDCEKLQRDYDEKIEQLAIAECRFRGRLIDLERKEGAFAKTLKQVDVTWSQLEADHAKNLEDIGRRLEEKVECNRRIMQRVAELELLAKLEEEKKKSCSCKCNDSSSISTDFSSSISSAKSAENEAIAAMDQVDDANNNEPMDVDRTEVKTAEARKITQQLSRQTQTDLERSLRCSNCNTNKRRIDEMFNESSRRDFTGASSIKTVRVSSGDLSTEIAVEATEDIGEKATTRCETDGAISRVRVMPEEERPAPEPAETLRVTINESELEKKVRESRRDERVDWEGEGLVVKTWNTESYNLKARRARRADGNGARKSVFRHGRLHYVLYPEICV